MTHASFPSSQLDVLIDEFTWEGMETQGICAKEPANLSIRSYNRTW